MKQHPYYTRVWVLKRHVQGPLAPHLEPFAAFLERRGYSYNSGQRFIREVGRLSRWAAARRIKAEDLSEAIVKNYLRFRFKGLGSKVKRGPYDRLLDYLRQVGVISRAPVTQQSSLSQCLRPYLDHLIYNQGLEKETIRRLIRGARCFLSHRFGNGAIEFSELHSQDIVRYLLVRSQQCGPSTLGLEASALRSFLRFLQFQGAVPSRLVKSVPTMRRWRQKSVPTFLKQGETSLLIQRCDIQTPKGRRDLAILLLLVRLGLRAKEVCRLSLDDIDWRGGYIIVHGKNGKCNRLPLLDEVGRAIGAYLCNSRPRCSIRHIFLRSVAPFDAFSSSSAVSHVVRSALARASLNPTPKGSHLLRHSLATHMLQEGASLADIGQILRHQRLDTTAIYAKVGMGQLRPIAPPWPKGGAS